MCLYLKEATYSYKYIGDVIHDCHLKNRAMKVLSMQVRENLSCSVVFVNNTNDSIKYFIFKLTLNLHVYNLWICKSKLWTSS